MQGLKGGEERDPFNIPFTFAFVQMKGMCVNAMTQREDREKPFQHSFRSNERYVCRADNAITQREERERDGPF